MELTPNSRWRLRLQNVLFTVLFLGAIGLLGWVSTIYKLQADWTAGNRNTLSDDTQRLLASIHEPIELVAFVPDNPALHQRVEENIAKYRRFEPELALRFSNPDLEPEVAQAAGITRTGQLLIRVGGRSETVEDISEQTLAEALQRLARDEQRTVVFLQGHSERDPLSADNPGFSRISDSLARGGIKVRGVTLIREPRIPSNTSLLVIASPQTALLRGEVEKLREYVKRGGNLLWLHDPGEPLGLTPLADDLGIDFVDGVIVDANQELRLLLGIQHPAVVPVVDYGEHAVSQDLRTHSLFPYTGGVEADTAMGWTAEPILTSLARTWAETGSLAGEKISFSTDAGDRAGPLTIGLSLTRDLKRLQQRVAVIGDSDFLADGYIGNGANLELGVNLFNWLAHDDALLSIMPKSAPDTVLALTETQIIAIGLTFLTALPIGLLGIGVTIWMRRRRR